MFVSIEFLGLSCPNRYGHSLSQGSGCHADTRKAFMSGRVPLKTRVDQAEGIELFNRKITASGQYAVENRRDVSVGEEKQIFVFSIHVKFLLSVHHDLVKNSEKLGTA